jgi:hypothetical protein
MVRCGPGLGSTPSALRPADGAATLAGLDSANLKDRLARARQSGGHVLHSIFADNHGHADATVEGACHFFGRDSPAGLQERENLRLFPAIGFYDGVGASRQNTRNILEKSATCYVRETLDAPLLNQR